MATEKTEKTTTKRRPTRAKATRTMPTRAKTSVSLSDSAATWLVNTMDLAVTYKADLRITHEAMAVGMVEGGGSSAVVYPLDNGGAEFVKAVLELHNDGILVDGLGGLLARHVYNAYRKADVGEKSKVSISTTTGAITLTTKYGAKIRSAVMMPTSRFMVPDIDNVDFHEINMSPDSAKALTVMESVVNDAKEPRWMTIRAQLHKGDTWLVGGNGAVVMACKVELSKDDAKYIAINPQVVKPHKLDGYGVVVQKEAEDGRATSVIHFYELTDGVVLIERAILPTPLGPVTRYLDQCDTLVPLMDNNTVEELYLGCRNHVAGFGARGNHIISFEPTSDKTAVKVDNLNRDTVFETETDGIGADVNPFVLDPALLDVAVKLGASFSKFGDTQDVGALVHKTDDVLAMIGVMVKNK